MDIGNITSKYYSAAEIDTCVKEYYRNDSQKIRKVVDSILNKNNFLWMDNKDRDEFYSLANICFMDAIRTFDGTGTFDGFLRMILLRKFQSFVTAMNRPTRCDVETIKDSDGNVKTVYHYPESLDAPLSDDGNGTLADIIPSKVNLEENFTKDNTRIKRYIQSLTPLQKQLAQLIMDGYQKSDIKNMMSLSEEKYMRILEGMKAIEKTRHLETSDYVEDKKLEEVRQVTLENNKDEKLSIGSIIKKIDNYTIRFDHPLQRSSEQWTKLMKSNLVSDVLQGNPLPEIVLAEQVEHGLALVWDIDGKQRCTIVHSYWHGGFKVDKKVTRPIITYQAIIRDKNGKPVLDDKGFPEAEKRSFDIRNKRFSDLPEELQDRFLDYSMKIVQYFNCSSEDIAYHIERYNSGRPMNTQQKGMTKLGEVFAGRVKTISSMPFFTELGGYSVSESRKGTLDRVVIESIMAIYFMDQWVKDNGAMCSYLQEHASEEMFDNVEEMVERLTSAGDDEFYSVFDSKNSFIYFYAFNYFTKFGLDDSRFVDFMIDFNKSLREKDVDGQSYAGLDKSGSATKDKNVVGAKTKMMESLMNDYFKTEEGFSVVEDTSNAAEDANNEEDDSISGDTSSEYDPNENTLSFIRRMVDKDADETDVEIYEDALNDYTIEIDESSLLLSEDNHNSMVAIVGYAFKQDVDKYIPEWIVGYNSKHNTYIKNQEENYLHMKNNLDRYIAISKKMSA